MSEEIKHSFEEGKYTLVEVNGKITAFRHGEPWPAGTQELIGDGLTLAMLYDYDRVVKENIEFRKLMGNAASAMITMESDMAMRARFAAAWRGEDTSDVALDVSHGRLMAHDDARRGLEQGMGSISLALRNKGVQDIDTDGLVNHLLKGIQLMTNLRQFALNYLNDKWHPSQEVPLRNAIDDAETYIDAVKKEQRKYVQH